LDEGKLAGSFLDSEELELIRDLQLLSAKPFIIVFNLNDTALNNDSMKQELETIVAPCPTVFICAKLEDELKTLDEKQVDYECMRQQLPLFIKRAEPTDDRPDWMCDSERRRPVRFRDKLEQVSLSKLQYLPSMLIMFLA
jgi:ribosome-binding ATPase YchF (GTP1/OBG family)